MEIERNLVQMIRTGPPEVLGRFWAGFRRIWRGFRAIYSYAPPRALYIYRKNRDWALGVIRSSGQSPASGASRLSPANRPPAQIALRPAKIAF